MRRKRQMCRPLSGVIALLAAGIAPVQAAGIAPVQAGTIDWSGYKWNVNSGAKMGSGQLRGDPANVTIDERGRLHLKIAGSGKIWTGSELGTTTNLGFGSYYWVFSGPLTTFEPQVVLGGFTYGPDHGVGSDGTNELDLEFSKWNAATNANNGDFSIFPAAGSKGASSELLWNWTSGTVATCRIDWSSTCVTESIWRGVVTSNAPLSTAAITWTYNGTTKTIPQSPCPMLFNFWSEGALPTHPVEAVIEKFQYLAPQLPDIPIGLSAAPADAQAILSWKASSFATSYNVYRGTGAGKESAIPVAAGLTGTSFTNSDLMNKATYYYKVAAVSAAGTSHLSHEVSATPTRDGSTNIAPSGTGSIWFRNESPSSDANKTASPGVNDNNLLVNVNVNESGEGGAARWEGAGVVWPSTHTVSSVKFTNGGDDGGGNGYLQSHCQLQFTRNGTTWSESGWTCSPAYPNSKAAFDQTYVFRGTAISGVKGARIVGQTGPASWRWSVKEVQIIGN